MRIVREAGVFAFAVMNRLPEQSGHYTARHDADSPDSTITLYRWSKGGIEAMLRPHGFGLVRWLPFTILMTPDESDVLEMIGYVARKNKPE